MLPEETDCITPAAGEPFVVMAKPAGPACNLQCNYCYYLEKTQLFSGKGGYRMSDDVLETYIRQYVVGSPGPEVLFVWHGGEPTLTGLDFFRKIISLQQKYVPDGKTCRNNLQTNGILLDDEWCAFLVENNFDVGISIDGTQWVHDAYRKDLAGRGTWDRVAESVYRLKEHGILPDLLCTITSETAKDPLGVYRALRNFDTGWIQFIPIIRRASNGTMTPESVTGEAYGKFLRVIFDEWSRNDLNRLNVQFFAEMMLVLSGGVPTVCWMAPTCGRVLIIEHDGGVYSCDHFVDKDHYIGNIMDSSLDDLIDSHEQLQFGQDKRQKLPEQCQKCQWLNLCNGGCLKDRILTSDSGETGLNYLCDGLQYFFHHTEKPLKKIVRRRQRGFSPETIMAGLQDEARALWKGIGRNDPCPCGSGLKAKNCCWSLRP